MLSNNIVTKNNIYTFSLITSYLIAVLFIILACLNYLIAKRPVSASVCLGWEPCRLRQLRVSLLRAFARQLYSGLAEQQLRRLNGFRSCDKQNDARLVTISRSSSSSSISSFSGGLVLSQRSDLSWRAKF